MFAVGLAASAHHRLALAMRSSRARGVAVVLATEKAAGGGRGRLDDIAVKRAASDERGRSALITSSAIGSVWSIERVVGQRLPGAE